MPGSPAAFFARDATGAGGSAAGFTKAAPQPVNAVRFSLRDDEHGNLSRPRPAGRRAIGLDTIAELAGRDFDLREISINLISLAGEVDESEDEFVLEWKNA